MAVVMERQISLLHVICVTNVVIAEADRPTPLPIDTMSNEGSPRIDGGPRVCMPGLTQAVTATDHKKGAGFKYIGQVHFSDILRRNSMNLTLFSYFSGALNYR